MAGGLVLLYSELERLTDGTSFFFFYNRNSQKQLLGGSGLGRCTDRAEKQLTFEVLGVKECRSVYVNPSLTCLCQPILGFTRVDLDCTAEN